MIASNFPLHSFSLDIICLGKGKIEHDNHQQSDILRSVNLRSFRNNECDLIYGGNGSIKKQHLCAYYEGLINQNIFLTTL